MSIWKSTPLAQYGIAEVPRRSSKEIRSRGFCKETVDREVLIRTFFMGKHLQKVFSYLLILRTTEPWGRGRRNLTRYLTHLINQLIRLLWLKIAVEKLCNISYHIILRIKMWKYKVENEEYNNQSINHKPYRSNMQKRRAIRKIYIKNSNAKILGRGEKSQ